MKYYMRRLLPSQFRKGMHIEHSGTITKVIVRACSKRGTHVEFTSGPIACYSPHVQVTVRISIQEEGENGQENQSGSGRKNKEGSGKSAQNKAAAQRRRGDGRGSKGSGRPRRNGGKGTSGG